MPAFEDAAGHGGGADRLKQLHGFCMRLYPPLKYADKQIGLIAYTGVKPDVLDQALAMPGPRGYEVLA